MNYYEQFKQKRYATIDYPAQLQEAMENAAESWKQFCTIPNDIKLQLGFSNYGGYELKQDGTKTDLKENIHYGLTSREQFEEFAQSLDSDEYCRITMELADHTDIVIDLVSGLIHDFIFEIQENINLPDIAQPIMDFRDHWIVRYLHYFPTSDLEQHAAAPHCDIGGFTLHLFQDHNGLEYLDNDMVWKPLPLEEGYTSILPGIQMQHVTENQVTSTCHRVVPTEESAVTGRYSAVLFTNWPNRPNWDKEKNGRQQDREPGFNYSLNFEELDALFTDSGLQDV